MKKIVLIADDEAPVRLMLMKILASEYEIIQAADGYEAVDMARRMQPDIVLMDIMMPGMNGYDACFRLKQDPATCNIPVVMVSGAGYELNRKLATGVGADGFVAKPFKAGELTEALGHLAILPRRT